MMKFLTEGKRINRVPSKISMPPNIASGTLIRTVLKVLFLYTLGSKVVELGQGSINEYHAVKVC